ncbi:MAG: rhodanese-related sulfurtransferase [Hyphomicrobiaceae bacterium]
MSVTVSAFYKFVAIADPPALRAHLLAALAAAEARGTILLAPEGINGTISAAAAAMAAFLAGLRADPRFADLITKNASAAAHPFRRLKVKVKREILTFGHPEADPTVRVGTYVRPEDWNALICDPNVLVLDTRNAYEVAVGTFAGAVDPGTRRFGEFADYVRANLDPGRHRRVAMFCTGGIRCEKASAYMMAAGFPEVYHLEGGILAYLAAVPPEQSLWRGACFVFDERAAVDAATTGDA